MTLQPRRRHALKNFVIESLGGKCVCCGYDKCENALVTHHLFNKDYQIGDWNFSINVLIKELRKCVLVCHNCHQAIHYEGLKIPENAQRFNEKYANKKIEEPCLICGELKPLWDSRICTKCSHKNKERVNWSSIDLQKMVRSGQTILKIARLLNVSAKTVRKRLIRAYYENNNM